MSWFRRQRHEHDWDRWRVMLTSLSAPLDEPVREARHCRTCSTFETRPKDAEQWLRERVEAAEERMGVRR